MCLIWSCPLYRPTNIGITMTKEVRQEQKGNLPESGEIAIKSGLKASLYSLRFPETILSIPESKYQYSTFFFMLIIAQSSISSCHTYCFHCFPSLSVFTLALSCLLFQQHFQPSENIVVINFLTFPRIQLTLLGV